MSSRWTVDDMPTLEGRVYVVTGANSGLGLETTRALAAHHAEVIMACRDLAKAEAAAADIRTTTPHARLVVLPLDLASLSSIERFANEIMTMRPFLDGLINNAGIMAIPRRVTADGFEMQFGTNVLGHFALTMRLLSLLEKRETPRVVTVASEAHRIGRMRFDDLMGEHRYSAWAAYGQSKLGNLLFAFEFERKLRAASKKCLSLAAHPGYSATNLMGVGAKMTNSKVSEFIMNLGSATLAQSPAMGALSTLRAATDPEARGGEYYGPSGVLRGYPVRVKGNARANNEDDARRLWGVAEELTRTSFAV